MKLYFASNIKFLRDQHGLSQEQLGKKLNKDYTTIGKWENGVRTPIVEDAIKIASFFNIPIEKLLLSDLRIKENEENKKIQEFATNNGIKVEIGQNSELTPNDTLEVIKFLTEKMNKKD